MSYDIHVCLISDQAAANFLPITDPQFKPKESIFFVSDKMKSTAEHLEKAFNQHNVKVTQSLLSDIFDFDKLETEMIECLEKYEDQKIILNVTGGTKLLAIAAQNVFNLLAKPIFYLDTENNQIVFISKSENNERLPKLSLNTNITLKGYLSAYGMKLLKSQQPNKENDAVEEMRKLFILNYAKNKNNLPILNLKAKESESNGNKIKLDKNQIFSGFDELLTTLKYADVIDYYDNTIDFKNKKNRDLLNGGWLEEYVYQQVKSIGKISEVYCNLEVGNKFYNESKNSYDEQNKGNMNEFDIAFLSRNKLHIIECKTQKLDKGNGIKAEDILYKLETLKDYGGLMTKKCLVSYFELPESVKNRAKELKIKIIEGSKIQNIKQEIQSWIGEK